MFLMVKFSCDTVSCYISTALSWSNISSYLLNTLMGIICSHSAYTQLCGITALGSEKQDNVVHA